MSYRLSVNSAPRPAITVNNYVASYLAIPIIRMKPTIKPHDDVAIEIKDKLHN